MCCLACWASCITASQAARHRAHASAFAAHATAVWQFSVVDRRWTALPPATAAQPAARDYAGGTLVGDQLFVFGGRYGGEFGCGRVLRGPHFTFLWAASLPACPWPPRALSAPASPCRHAGAPGAAAVSRPIGDRWLFDLQTRTWRQLPVRGLSPLPRFLFSWAHVQMNGSRGPSDQLLIFGGEGGAAGHADSLWGALPAGLAVEAAARVCSVGGRGCWPLD